MKDKLKVNMGFLAFETAKKLQPMKFNYRDNGADDDGDGGGGGGSNMKYSKFFKQNPDLIEFMRVKKKDDEKGEDDEETAAAAVAAA